MENAVNQSEVREVYAKIFRWGNYYYIAGDEKILLSYNHEHACHEEVQDSEERDQILETVGL